MGFVPLAGTLEELAKQNVPFMQRKSLKFHIPQKTSYITNNYTSEHKIKRENCHRNTDFKKILLYAKFVQNLFKGTFFYNENYT